MYHTTRRSVAPATTPEPPPLTDLLNTSEFARLRGCSPYTVRSYIAQGLIRAYRLGPRNFRIPRSELDRLLTEVEAA